MRKQIDESIKNIYGIHWNTLQMDILHITVKKYAKMKMDLRFRQNNVEWPVPTWQELNDREYKN